MNPRKWTLLSLSLALCFAVLPNERVAVANELSEQSDRTTELRVAENAFAKTMADRDLEGFAKFLSSEVVFFTGDSELRGKDAVTQAWARYFEGDAAPFSWKPEAAAVLDSGELGFTSGPVLDVDGKRVGTFNSVWRRLPDGHWEIIFDRGCPACE